MPHLATGSLGLAVEVNPGVGHSRKQMVQPLVDAHGRRLRGAEHIGHHRHGHHGVAVAERVVQDRAQMLLELAGARPVDGPVPGIMWPHRELVDQQRPVGRLEQLDGEHADHTEFVGQLQRQPLRRGGQVVGQRRRRRDHQHTRAVTLHRLDHRPRRTLAERRTRHQCRQLAAQVHPFLDQHRHAVSQAFASEITGIRHITCHPNAPAVVTPAHCLDHDRGVDTCGEDVDFVGVFDARVAGHGDACCSQTLPHDEFVLGVHQRLRRRCDIDAIGD
ncbi:Uncharacterised protein [Mycobacterium tuberculosis]|nr:Uncharacterised protein [Mycobacterium tuberculosis]